jgi:hypothetical protein
MDRHFDYQQKILVAVEFADKPRALSDLPPSYTVFQRIGIPEIKHAAEQLAGPMAGSADAEQFGKVLDHSMGYWEHRVPAGKQCYVHYAIGSQQSIDAAYARLAEDRGLVSVGVYHVEPQSSAYPASFPYGPAPDNLHLGKTHGYGKDSIFWFNFFPAQPYLFEKTFPIWARFVVHAWVDGGGCNQLVAADEGSARRLRAQGVDEFVQVNLNRFGSLRDYFDSARAAGEGTFTVDPDYTWYGMLLRKA